MNFKKLIFSLSLLSSISVYAETGQGQGKTVVNVVEPRGPTDFVEASTVTPLGEFQGSLRMDDGSIITVEALPEQQPI